MSPKYSITILKTLIFLILNFQLLHASKKPCSSSEVRSPSPLVPPVTPKTLQTSETPDFTPEYSKFLQDCEKKLTVECSEEVIENTFGDGKLSKKCCAKLVDSGPDCHTALVQGEDNLIRDYNVNRKEVLAKSDKLYKKCEKLVPHPKEKHYPKLPPRELRPGYDDFLEECAKTITEKCGNEVVYAVFNDDYILHLHFDCCEKLYKMGRECHDELLRGLSNLAVYQKVVKDIKAKSDEIWNRCQQMFDD